MPLFLGSQPLMVRRGIEAGWSPLYHESTRGFDLMQSLTPEQQLLLRLLVMEFVGNAGHDGARTQLLAIDHGGWDEFWFAWRGPTDDQDDLFYYRVHGERVLLELAWEARNHIHAIIRDPLNDYGEDWLGLHYAENHPDMSAIMEEVREQIRNSEEESP